MVALRDTSVTQLLAQYCDSCEGFADADATQLRLSDLLTHLPVAVLKARFNGAAAKPARKRSRV